MIKEKKPTVEEIILKAVTAQRIADERQQKDVFKATERRLYAYPVISIKIADDRERIKDIQNHGTPNKSKSVVRYQRAGVRLAPDEIAEELINDITAEIAGNESELERIDKAIGIIANDKYADVVRYKYFEGKSDEEIAVLIPCDPSTVRRHKGRLVSRIAVYLYGVAAVV